MAIRLMRMSLCEPLSVSDLARRCGLPERTLNEHFRTFVGQSPMRYLRRLRLAAAREALRSGDPGASVTGVAQRFLFAHAGRFSQQYRDAFGELPSATRRRAGGAARPDPAARSREAGAAPAILLREVPSVAIVVGGAADCPPPRLLMELADALASALSSVRWLSVISPVPATADAGASRPSMSRTGARYVIRLAQAQDRGRLRLSFDVRDRATGAVVWGDRIDGAADEPLAVQDRLVRRVRDGLAPALRRAEMDRAARVAPRDLDAWGLAMRAMPLLSSATPEGASRALELLERALAIDPDYSLPMALAAWGHGQLVMYNATSEPGEARDRAVQLARRAAIFGADDPLELTARCAVHMMLGDLDTAEALVGRALSRDPTSGWAWGRSGWLQTYRGNHAAALRHFQRALRLDPQASRANTLVGIGCAHFDAGRYAPAAHWVERALREQPAMEWCNRSLSVSYARLGERRKARRSLEVLQRYHPDLAVSDVVAAVPFRADFLNRLANGLDDLGLPP